MRQLFGQYKVRHKIMLWMKTLIIFLLWDNFFLGKKEECERNKMRCIIHVVLYILRIQRI
jgi:hypothetical protein